VTTWTAVKLLSQQELAKRAGLAESSIRTYKTRGRLPRPDITIGGPNGTPGWTEATADAWIATLPGHGHRTDLDVANLLSKHPDEVDVDGVTVEIMWDREWTRPSEYDADAWHLERGICARIVSVRLGEHPTFRYGTPLGWVRAEWGNWPTWLEGVPESELGRALRTLAATGKAIAAHDQVRADRAALVLRAVRRAREEYEAIPRNTSYAHGLKIRDAGQKLALVVEMALEEGVAYEDDVYAAAGDAIEVQELRRYIGRRV
jgi:predicted DNA-binding transcriptional regulator AlpA